MTDKQSYAYVLHKVVAQSYMLATDDLFWLSAILFISLLILTWFAKPPFFAKDDVMVE